MLHIINILHFLNCHEKIKIISINLINTKLFEDEFYYSLIVTYKSKKMKTKHELNLEIFYLEKTIIPRENNLIERLIKNLDKLIQRPFEYSLCIEKIKKAKRKLENVQTKIYELKRQFYDIQKK